MDDDSLHTLLARGKLSGEQRDRILAAVLRAHAAPSRRRRWWPLMAAALLAAGIAVALVLRVPRGVDGGDAEYLASKGADGRVLIDARCPERPPGHCRVGDLLIFEVDGAEKPGSFAGYAECERAERTWFFPDAAGKSPSVSASSRVEVLPRGARLGPEHAGSCRLHLFVLAEPAERAILLSGKARVWSSAVIPLTVAP
jgi:hypothetical protein